MCRVWEAAAHTEWGWIQWEALPCKRKNSKGDTAINICDIIRRSKRHTRSDCFIADHEKLC